MSIAPRKWLEIIKGLAEQNGSVRVCLSSKPIGEGGQCARTRVLALDGDGQTLIEEPGFREVGGRLRPGAEIDVLVVSEGIRLVGYCQVAEQVKYALNKKTRVDALLLSPPTKVESGQLRDFYRAPVGAGVDIDPVLLWLDEADELTAERAGEAGIDPLTVHKALLLNISGGGVGLALAADKALASVLQIGTSCVLRAELPELDEPLEQRGRLVHVDKLDHGDLYLGIQFQFDDPAVQKRVEDQMQRLSVWLQRRVLKKDRGD